MHGNFEPLDAAQAAMEKPDGRKPDPAATGRAAGAGGENE
jgi:hypothetical protein